MIHCVDHSATILPLSSMFSPSDLLAFEDSTFVTTVIRCSQVSLGPAGGAEIRFQKIRHQRSQMSCEQPSMVVVVMTAIELAVISDVSMNH